MAEATIVPHAASGEEIAAALGADAERGLDPARASDLLARHGPNRIEGRRETSVAARFLRQFREFVVWILIAAAAISLALGHRLDAVVIAAIVVLNAVLGFVQEERGARALASLRRLARPRATVIRDGLRRDVDAADLVPGDLLTLEAGDQVPADARLVEAVGLRTEESALTGESGAVRKDAAPILDRATGIADRTNMAHMGTVVVAGRATALVTATGMATEFGRIALLLESGPDRSTPLQRRMAGLGRVLVVACFALIVLIAAIQLLRGIELVQVFILAVSLAVAAVPEGLPAFVTVVLALGIERMARRKALVRHLPSVETLGSVTVICSDKTGTLTQNELTVRVLVAGDRLYRVEGTGYEPRGAIRRIEAAGSDPAATLAALRLEEETGAPPIDPAAEVDLVHVLLVAARCNHARVAPGDGADGAWRPVGDPTEAALVTVALKAGIGAANEEVDALFEIPFEAERRMMTVVTREPGERVTAFTKGAPEVVLPRCVAEWRDGAERPLDDARRQAILAASGALAARSMRVLALADRAHPGPPGTFEERDLVFAGLAAMYDPPRPEARAAVATCRAAGIRPLMMTGDHPGTALAVAREVGLADATTPAVTGRDLDAMTPAELRDGVERTAVYARVSAEHKLRLVEALQARGHVVAMTGDGVNDAPAVNRADIGIAMGRSGTDVTREAADMILLDDNFATIVAAVEEGRTIFANVQRFVHYLLATNAGEVMLMLVTAVLGWPVPLLATHLLWINLVTDGLPALALGLEPAGRDVMRRPPHPPEKPVISRDEGAFILARGAMVAAVAAAGFAWSHGGIEANLGHARVVTFSVVAYAQLFYAFAFRSRRRTLPELGLLSNRPLLAAIALSAALQFLLLELPFTRAIFGLERPLGADWWVVGALALLPVTVVEVGKLARAWRRRPHPRVAA